MRADCHIERNSLASNFAVGHMLKRLTRHVLCRLTDVDADDELAAWRDPLMHPVIQRMSMRELADLPMAHVRTCRQA